MHTNDDFILFINKTLTGEIQPDEQDLLNKWMAQSPENQQIEQDLRLIWQQSGPVQKTFTPDLNVAFAQVLDKIQLAEKPVRVAYVTPMLWRAAAAVVLLIASVYTWQYVNKPATALQSVVAMNVDKQYLELPDGSKVWLRQGAKIQYPAKFGRKDRKVQLEGEAFFEVHHDAAHPFKVMVAGGGMIEVLGTSFDVNVKPQAEEHSVFVRTGKVRYMPENKANSALLVAGKKATFSHSKSTLKVADMASPNELSWQTGGLEFVNTPIETVITDLERHYSVKIALRNPDLKRCTFTAPLTNQPVDKVLEGFALVFDMKLTKNSQGTFVLTGGTCR